jgi:hypothetical protein
LVIVNTIDGTGQYSLLRRGLHEVSCEGKVSAQGVMGRTHFNLPITPRALTYSGNFTELEKVSQKVLYKDYITMQKYFIKESLSTTMHCAPKPAWRPF